MMGLALPAAAHEAGHLINGGAIKKHSIAGNRLKPNTVTGAAIKESTLGEVPKAKALPRLTWHPVTFIASDHWSNYGSPYFPVAYALDSQGIVHFRGAMKNTGGGVGAPAFLVPGALAPKETVSMPYLAGGTTAQLGDLEINGVNVTPYAPAGAATTAAATYTSLDGVTYSVH